jgi:hypothetical protein
VQLGEGVDGHEGGQDRESLVAQDGVGQQDAVRHLNRAPEVPERPEDSNSSCPPAGLAKAEDRPALTRVLNELLSVRIILKVQVEGACKR